MAEARDLTDVLNSPREGPFPPPPVKTLRDRLPFQDLHWPDFERLCKRLLDQQPGLEQAQAYGRPGDEQGGIDIYARRVESEQHVVVQAKKVTSFGPAKVKHAVDRFLGLDKNGKPRKGAEKAPWHQRADEFILAVTFSLNGQQVDEQWRIQETRLKDQGITASRWGTENLEDQLRTRPDIVYEFFGQEWVDDFCTNPRKFKGGLRTSARTASSPPEVETEELRRLVALATQNFMHESGAVHLPWQDRDEVADVVTRLQDPEARQVLILTGRAGLGKSGVTARVVEQLQKQHWPVLAFRLDLLQPTDHERKLGESLGLPVSPVEALAGASQGQPCLLVIDQLDAVSKASGRQPQFFEVARRLLTAAEQHPNLRILMACREFDLANDDRFKILVKAKVPVALELPLSELSAEQVRTVLSSLGFAPDRLSASQLAILRIPLHLSLFYEGWTERTGPEALTFQTVNDLYRLYTRRKEERLRERLAMPDFPLNATLAPLVQQMSDDMTLSLPEAATDQLALKTALYSEGILRRQAGRIAFFHEGYFDHLFARQFIAERKNLLLVLLGSEQHLFRRAQVRQVLTLLREQDRSGYFRSVHDLLSSPEVRFHLKELVFSLLWLWPDPTAEEWDLIEPLMTSLDRDLAELARWSLYSVTWSRFLLENGTLIQWFESTDPEENRRSATVLDMLLRADPDVFLGFVRPFLGRSEDLDRRIVDAVGWRVDVPTRDFFEFITDLFERKLLDDHRYWHALETLSKTHIEWAIEGCARLLQNLASSPLTGDEIGTMMGRVDHVITEDWPATEIFRRAVSSAPALVVDQLLPALLALAEKYTYTDRLEKRFREDMVWQYRLDFGVDHATDALLEGVIEALGHLSADKFRGHAERLMTSELEVAQYILLCGYLEHAASCADEAVLALCDEPARLRVGEGGSLTRLSFKLLRATTPMASAEVLQTLEQVLLHHRSRWETSRPGYGTQGLTEYRLLAGIVPEKRSEAVRRRYAELTRKFPNENPEVLGRTHWAGMVGPPIPANALERMSDEQWLGAMLKYDSDGMDSHRHTDDGGITGGASELASALGQEARKDPERFARLALTWPDTLNPVYFERLVSDLRDSTLDVDLTVRLAQRCHALPGRPCGRWLPDLFGQRPDLDWPRAALEIVSDCALNDPDPAEDTWQRPNSFRSPDMQGINSVRGTAAEVIGKLLFARPERFEVFRPTIEQLLGDPVVAVRVCAALPVGVALNIDADLAITWFCKLAETRDEFLSGRHAVRFLEYAIHRDFERIWPLIERMVNSHLDELSKPGAGLATVASFRQPQAQGLAARVLSGTISQRLGVAEVLSVNFGMSDAAIAQQCMEGLGLLFLDPDQGVRNQAARFPSRLDASGLPRYADLIRTFLASPAFREEPLHLLHQLQQSALQLPGTLLDAAEAYLGEQHQQTTTQGSRDAHYVREFGQLIFPLYSQHLNRVLPDTGMLSRCLNLFDRMAARRSQEYHDGMQLAER